MTCLSARRNGNERVVSGDNRDIMDSVMSILEKPGAKLLG